MQVEPFSECAKGRLAPIFPVHQEVGLDAHRILSLLIVAVGTGTALLGLGIVTIAVMVRVRVTSSRRRRPSFEA